MYHMRAWEHPQWSALFLAWLHSAPESGDRVRACLAVADAADEVGDDYLAFVWRRVMPEDARAEKGE